MPKSRAFVAARRHQGPPSHSLGLKQYVTITKHIPLPTCLALNRSLVSALLSRHELSIAATDALDLPSPRPAVNKVVNKDLRQLAVTCKSPSQSEVQRRVWTSGTSNAEPPLTYLPISFPFRSFRFLFRSRARRMDNGPIDRRHGAFVSF